MKKIKNGEFVFWCETEIEEYRVSTMFTKEEGTIRWLNELQPSEVFYDVGANIGIYSIYAAKRVAQVYAFEPHVGNAAALLRNIDANGFRDSVVLVTSALHSSEGYMEFNYASIQPGSSGHQLGHTRSESGKEFTPVAKEWKDFTTIDALCLRHADCVKIDVDGNELHVLKGMWSGLDSVRSVQVEIHQQSAAAIHDLMTSMGFEFSERHDTANGKKLLASGAAPESVTHNAIFRRQT